MAEASVFKARPAMRRVALVIALSLYAAVLASTPGGASAASRRRAPSASSEQMHAHRHKKKPCSSKHHKRHTKPRPPCTILPTFEGTPNAPHSSAGGPFPASVVRRFDESGDDEERAPIPIGPFIAPPTQAIRPMPAPQEAGPSEQSSRPAHGADALGLQIVRNIDLKRGSAVTMPVASTLEDDDGSEQSVATNGRGLVLYTTNSRDAVSFNGGRTFSGLDPTTIFPNDASYGGFCCDQVVTYVPSVDRFVWVLQYYEGGGGIFNSTQPNEIRVATATSAEFQASSGTSWQYYDWTPSELGAKSPGPGKSPFLDRPHVAFSHGMLSLSVSFGLNPDNFVYGYAIWRFPLAQLGSTIYPTVIQSQAATVKDAGYFSGYAPAQNNIFNNSSSQYFATRLTTSRLGLVQWTDRGSPVFYEIDVPTIATKNNKVDGFGGPVSDWASRWVGDGVVVTGARTGRVVWFGWSAGRDALTPDGKLVHVHSQPAVEFVGIDVATLRYVDYESIEFSDATTVNPQIRVNGEGVLGVDFMFGGPLHNPSYTVGFLRPDYAAAVAASGGVTDPGSFQRSADYLGLAVDPEQRNCFVAAGSAVKVKPDGKLYDDPHYVVFGRATHCRLPPVSRSDIFITSVSAGLNALTVFGAIDPAVSGAQVYVDYTPSVGGAFSHNVLTDANGTFSDTATVRADQVGLWTIGAHWFGQGKFGGSAANPFPIDVGGGSASPPPPPPGGSSLTLVCPLGTATSFPATAVVSGSLTPAVGGSVVVVTYTPPSGPAIVHSVPTAADGSYSDSVVVQNDQIYATWTVRAHFDGDTTRAATDSPSCGFTPHYP